MLDHLPFNGNKKHKGEGNLKESKEDHETQTTAKKEEECKRTKWKAKQRKLRHNWTTHYSRQNIWMRKLKWLKKDEIEDEQDSNVNVKGTQIHHGWALRHNGRMVPKEQW